ncbi:MAG: hypothetical protein V1752_04165 [Candidatus Firestonebacteria bacterium]
MNKKEKKFKIINITSVVVLFFFFILPLQADTAEDQQILRGMVSVVRSLDAYMKGIYGYDGLVGENSEVNGDLYLCEYIMMTQYPSKADGYLRFYAKTGFPEYKILSQQIIDKIYRVYDSTTDKDGKHWLPTQAFIANDGKFYGYSQGPNFTRNGPNPVPYNQSKGKYQIEGAGFPDAWGIGMYELSKMADYLDDDHKKKLITILEGMVDFWNRDYMRYKKAGIFLYRTEDVEPLNPKPQVKKPKWSCSGSDLIYSIIALNELKQNTDHYDTNLMLFLKSYVDERVNHSGEFRIDYLDSRMIELANYFKNKEKYLKLADWVLDKVPYIYKKKVNKVIFMIGGSTSTASTIPLLDFYAQMGRKDKFKELWSNIWTKHFGEKGIKISNEYNFTINNSAYPILLDAGYQGWLKGILNDEEFADAVKKYYMFKGDENSYRKTSDWVLESDNWDKEKGDWQATPFDNYPEQVEPEAYYKEGKPQGFSTHYLILSGFIKEINEKQSQDRNRYYQFAAPFENHGEKLRYGLAQTFNLILQKIRFHHLLKQMDY